MRKLAILLVLIICSCNSKNESKNTEELTYQFLTKENEKYNSYLLDNIKTEIEKHKNNSEIISYEKFTKDYLDYLSIVESEISKNNSDIFFEKDNYSNKGKVFIKKTEFYKNEIEKLVSSENLKKRINLVLNTNDVGIDAEGKQIAKNNENGEIKVNNVYVKYLDYYFRQLSINQTLTFISAKKRAILEIENEFVLQN